VRQIPASIPDSWNLGNIQLCCRNDSSRVSLYASGHLSSQQTSRFVHVLFLSRRLHCWFRHGNSQHSVSFILNPADVKHTDHISGHTKKVTTNAMIFIAYCVSNIIAPQFFEAHQAPLYPLGMGAILASYGLSLITIIAYMAYCARENRRRNLLDPTSGQKTHADTDFKDLTDKENIHFRYVW
jgi:hypothetical protein